MRLEFILNEIISTKINKEGIYSSLNASKVISTSFDIVRSLNKLNKDCWEDLSTQFGIYKQNRAYYIKYGGVCPSLESQLSYKQNIQELREIKYYILNSIDDIKRNNWNYDIGYCKYIRELRDILRLQHMI